MSELKEIKLFCLQEGVKVYLDKIDKNGEVTEEMIGVITGYGDKLMMDLLVVFKFIII